MDRRQLCLDWFAGMIANVPLPTTGSVSGEVLRAVLLAIYRIPGEAGGQCGSPCWAGQAAIAGWSTRWLETHGHGGRSVSERTARRALAVLESELQMVVSYRAARPESRTRKTLDHYVIQWTAVGMALDEMRGVTRPSPTRETPATRPDQSDVEQGSWPVDRPAWPVDRPAWPVDRPAWPVDRRADTISARALFGQEKDPESSTTANPDPDTDTDARRKPDGTDGRTERAAAVEFLREVGVTTAAQRVDELAGRGIAYQAILAECRRLWAIAQGNASRFRSGPACGLAYRLRTGDWPCAVDEDLQAVASRIATRQCEADGVRWQRVLDQAWRSVRGRTPVGHVVDDCEVAAEAVRLGVPETVAVRERGLNRDSQN